MLHYGPILKRPFYERPTAEVARALLGKVLMHGAAAGIIVETEAYPGRDDLASHSARGITGRTRIIFGPPGHAYVYLIYGMYECLNLVTEPAGTPGCVLIRALEPVAGIELMRERRPAAGKLEDIARGPGRLTMAMAITRADYGADVTRGSLVVREPASPRALEIQATPRIGIRICAERPLRFILRGNRFVSGRQSSAGI
ncbi:MAG: DNA-3-methyladenine glycosylase [Bryobacteraceae bacterium]